MKTRNILSLIFLLVFSSTFAHVTSTSASSETNSQKLSTLFIYDGIILPPSMANDNFIEERKAIIDSITVEEDSVYDCMGELAFVGIVRIYTKDTINSGAKRIMELTDNWMYRQPTCRLMINNEKLLWDEETYHRILGLKADDIIYVKLKKKLMNAHDLTLKIKIKK